MDEGSWEHQGSSGAGLHLPSHSHPRSRWDSEWPLPPTPVKVQRVGMSEDGLLPGWAPGFWARKWRGATLELTWTAFQSQAELPLPPPHPSRASSGL